MGGWGTDMKDKQKIFTGFLLVMIIGLLFSIIYISRVLLSGEPETSQVAPRRIKAAGRTYSRLLAINKMPEPTSDAESSLSPTPTVDPGVFDALTTPTEVPITPEPTETILAYQSLSGTVTPTAAPSATGEADGTTNLPEAGYIQNMLILFAVSSLFLFIAFLF